MPLASPNDSRMYSFRAMVLSATSHFLYFVLEEHLVNAPAECLAGQGVGIVVAGAVELAFDLPRMRRQQQDAVADHHRFRNGVRHEKHGELCVLPELEQLFL